MKGRSFRVSLRLEPEAHAEQVLASLEALLGRPAEPVWRLERAGVLSMELTEDEMEKAGTVPGVISVRRERRAELPCPPRIPREEK